jgi:two-component system sensor histidine kinase BarA
MDDCVSKPVNEAQLAHIINRWACLTGKREVVIHEDSNTAPEKLLIDNKSPDTSSSVDILLCLKLANNKPALARDMLKMMLDGLPTEKENINQAIATNNVSALTELIHRLYGSSCYCGVPRLKSISGLLDKLLQAKEIEEAQNAIGTLNHAIDDVISWGKDRDLNDVFGIKLN